MACPIPIRIINPHYKKIASLSDNPNELDSYSNREDFYLDVPCGVCYHCRKTYKTQWNLRLQHHFRYLSKEQQANSYFVTLTFSNEHLPNQCPSKADVAPLIRKFLERIRKKYKRSVVHWIVSEYGDVTHRYHLHGILFDVPFPIHELSTFWKYGYVSYRKLNAKRITYVTTYVNKQLKGLIEDKRYRQHVFCSPKIGLEFTKDSLNITYARQHDTIVPFIFHNRRPFAMPRYYRSKIFSEDELETLKNNYFHFLSEDVIPVGPYILGNTRYNDYTLYLNACARLRSFKNLQYRKNTLNSSIYEQSISQSDFAIT
ncbi:MAG: hypothetical protein IKU96_00395 [Alistipes sp.]|nr:hypothetical protein [Alistipes sp.]